ncbi:MAG TPA: TonB-dependent receptor [Kofleriaceae bacterium]
MLRMPHLIAALILALPFQYADAEEPAPAPPAEAPPAETPPAEAPAEAPPGEAPPADAPPAPITVTGSVTDQRTGEGLPAAYIQIKGGEAQTVATELDGTFSLALPPGTYKLTFSTPEFDEQTKTITVKAGKVVELVITLAPTMVAGKAETIEVYDTIDTRKESATLAVRRAAPTVSDALSSQEISRTPDSNAGDAMKRVVAVTVSDGKYVALRGLEGRYVTTLLNGVLLPSPEPDRNAIPLDLFPTSLLSTMTVYKSYSAELPGQFGGGALSIDTSSFPSKFELKLGISTSANTVATGAQGMTNANATGAADFFGFDDGTRRLPDAVPRNRAVRNMTAPELEQIGESFNNVWTPDTETVTPNLGVNATVGNTTKLFDKRVGYLGTGMFRRNFSVKNGENARNALIGGELTPIENLEYNVGVAESTVGGLANVGVELDRNNDISLFGLYSHAGENASSLANGYSEADSSQIDVTRLSFVMRSLAFSQLAGKHKISRSRGAELRWQANVAQTTRDELDSRDLIYTIDETSGTRYYKDQPGSGQRFWQSLSDLAGGGGADFQIRAGRAQFKTGALAQVSQRSLIGRRFRYKWIGSDPSVRSLEAEDMFAPEHIGPDFVPEEGTLNEDAYKASLGVYAAFATAEVQLDDKMRGIAGVRYEHSTQSMSNGSRYAIAGLMTDVARTDDDVLPAANLVYAARPDMNVRFAYSYTLGRPRFRELAPFLFFDYIRRRAISGNPNLLTTHIHNADLRWEWFPSDNEVIAVSTFAKQFADPIEQVLANSESDATFANAKSGNLIGAEIEARRELTKYIRLGANFSLLRSRVQLGDDQMLQTTKNRALYGQAPFVVNVSLGYVNPKIVEANLLYNVTGRRITDVGIEGLPDTYEAPLNRVDLVAVRNLAKDLRLKLSASNLLNQKSRLEQGGLTVNTYSPGVSFALGLDWTP